MVCHNVSYIWECKAREREGKREGEREGERLGDSSLAKKEDCIIY